MFRPIWFVAASCLLSVIPPGSAALARDPAVVSPVRRLISADAGDQDDMCFWLHPVDRSRSTVIVSDKKSGRVFVYDLHGVRLQTLPVPKPGNVDIRYDFPLGGERVDIVALNDRKTKKIHVYKVDRMTRLLSRVDDDAIDTGGNYGFALYRSHATGRTYAFTGPETGPAILQWELVDNGAGRVSGGNGPLRRLYHDGVSEGMVADDETGTLYMAEEQGGVWKYNAEPTGATSGTRIAAVGEHGLTHDVEGLTIYYRSGGDGYLIVSSQGSDDFKVYDRKPPHAYRGTFSVSGTSKADGCDVINLPLGATFPDGAFVCHNGSSKPCPNELVRWSDIASGLGLGVDTTTWDPRRSGRSPAGPGASPAHGSELRAAPNGQ
jgi:3-phytase